MVVSHDRAFLRALTDRTLWVDRGDGAAAGAGVRRLRGVARQGLRGGGRGAAQARPLHPGRGALGGRGDLGAAQAQHGAGAAARRAARRAAGRRSGGRGRRRLGVRGRAAVGEARGRGGARREAVRRAHDRARLLGPDRARRAGGAGRAERGRQDHAPRHPDRGAGAGRGAGAARGEPGAGGVRPEPGGARSRAVALGDADRRRAGGQRPGDGARAAAARRRLPQGVPVRRGAGARGRCRRCRAARRRGCCWRG